MPRRPDARAIRKHRNYTVEEAANALKMHKGSVRRWLKVGLPAVTDKRPTLILGSDLIAFLAAARPKRQPCAIDQAFCLSCRPPRRPAFDEVQLVDFKGGSARIFALCEVCGTTMHKCVSAAQLHELRRCVTVSIGPDHERICQRALALLNDHSD